MAVINQYAEIAVKNTDCSYFENPGDDERLAIEYIARNLQSPNVFKISGRVKEEDDAPVISYDYKRKKWLTGRYIGSAQITSGDRKIELNIEPRFGRKVLYQMLAEIFEIRNIRFSPDARSVKNGGDELFYLKILVSFLWLNMLAKSNRHGLPRINSKQRQQSSRLKGRLLIGPSLVPLYTAETLVSETRFKQYDQIIIRLLYQAYMILKRDYGLGTLNMPPNAQEAIQHIATHINDTNPISEQAYRNIRYQPIYANYQTIVDFSWQIIKGKYRINRDEGQDNQMMGFFLDMAEIWECYLQKMLVKHLSQEGWRLHENEFTVYSSLFFRRKLIPDIVLKRDDSYLVFDAKWKRMLYSNYDVDRSDFFQIHTYISHLQTIGRVKAGGLIYPAGYQDVGGRSGSYSPSLFNMPLDSTAFMVGGPYISDSEIDFSPLWEMLENIKDSSHW